MKRIGIRVPEHLWLQLKNIAEYKGYTLNKLVLDSLWKCVKEKDDIGKQGLSKEMRR